MQDAMDNGNIVIHRNDLRSFTSFQTIESFISWYDTVPIIYRCFDEVVTGDRKFILDIDCKNDTIDWDLMIYYCRTQIMSHFPNPNIFIYDSHGANVLSSHVIVSNYMMDNDTSYYIADCIYKSIPEEYSRYIDMGVYKKVQFMRLEGSRKASSNRYMYLSNSDKIHDMRLSMLGYGIENYIPITYRRNAPRRRNFRYKPISGND